MSAEHIVVTADDLRALADAVDDNAVRVIRHKNLLAVVRPATTITMDALTMDEVADALKRSPRR